MDTPSQEPVIPPPPGPLGALWSWAAPCLLISAVFAAYAGALSSPWLFDDAPAVLNNPTLREFWSWSVLNPPADGGTTTGRPLVNLSLALNYALSGLAPTSYHVFNLLIHVGSALALWGVLRRILPPPFPSSCAPVPRHAPVGSSTPSSVALGFPQGIYTWLTPFLLALLWALHPLQSETVVCIAQRTEGLFGLFFLSTFYCFLRASTSPGPSAFRWSAAAVLCSLLGMASKEVMVVVPPLLLLFDRCLLSGSFAAAWRARRGLHLALASTWLLLAFLVLRAGGSRGVSAGFGLGISSWDYFLTQCQALVHYLRLCFWPHPLVLDYGTGLVSSLSAVWPQGLLLSALFLASLWALVRRPALGFVGLAFFVVLGPSSSFLPLVSQTIAEHRMYVPLAAVLLLVVLPPLRLAPRLTLVLLALACIGAGLGTWLRVRDYRDAVTVWESNIAAWPSNARAHNNLAVILQERGDHEGALRRYREALALSPLYVQAHYNLGSLLLSRSLHEEARRHLARAVELAPANPDAHLNLGNALMRLGQAAAAVPHFEQSLRLRPAPDAHYNLGLAYASLGRTPLAIAEFRELLASGSPSVNARHQLATLLEPSSRSEAERLWIEALSLDPAHIPSRRALGMLYARTERLDKAGEQFLALTRLRPDDAEAWGNLGNVALFQGRIRDAIAHYEKALLLDPSNRQLHQNLQVAREYLRD